MSNNPHLENDNNSIVSSMLRGDKDVEHRLLTCAFFHKFGGTTLVKTQAQYNQKMRKCEKKKKKSTNLLLMYLLLERFYPFRIMFMNLS